MNEAQGAVVVTGTSTGIGRATAFALDRLGYRVFAGVRRDSDGATLAREASRRLQPIRLDVTEAASIASARAEVTAALGADGLQGLVNNAGVLFSGPLEFLPLDDLRRQFEVNVFGEIAVTQAFLSLIRMGKGRIVNVGSVAGRVSAPFVSPLSASKFAMESFTDALRLELHRWGIPVVLIEPGFVVTPAVDKVAAGVADVLFRLPAEGSALYGEAYGRMMERMLRDNRKGVSADAVATVIVKALTVPRPQTRYVVGAQARLFLTLAALLPDRVLDRIRIRVLGLTSAGRSPLPSATERSAKSGVAP